MRVGWYLTSGIPLAWSLYVLFQFGQAFAYHRRRALLERDTFGFCTRFLYTYNNTDGRILDIGSECVLIDMVTYIHILDIYIYIYM